MSWSFQIGNGRSSGNQFVARGLTAGLIIIDLYKKFFKKKLTYSKIVFDQVETFSEVRFKEKIIYSEIQFGEVEI